MKRTLLFCAIVVLLCGCGNNNTPSPKPIMEESVIIDTFIDVEEVASDTLVAKPVVEEMNDTTTICYLNAMPAGYNEDDCFGLVLNYGGYAMDASAWPTPEGDWLITWHWCMEEDESGTITRIDENGNEVPVVYNDPFEGQPYPVIHKPDLSFSTRNYGGETINFYSAPDSDVVLCSTNLKEIGLDVIAADLKTRRLLVCTNPNDWVWAKPGEETAKPSVISPDESEDEFDFEARKYPYVELRGWIDEEWVCGNTMTTCP